MRKRRTREHIIADLSVNHVERFVLRAGHVADRVFFDYGYDLTVRTFDSIGQVEQDFILIQIKASDTPRVVQEGKFFAVRVAEGDLQAWLAERNPVAVVFYDVQADMAYWTHVQATEATLDKTTLRIPVSQRFDEDAVELLRQRKNLNS